jgi:multidrug efflux pump
MAKFFIDRPIFAWVIALFIMVLGAVSIGNLPVAQYPTVAPPSIVVAVTYPGASAQTLEDSVLAVIEREMNGAPGLAYMEAVSQANGTGTLTLSFEPGTNPDLAQVEVQNRLSRATPRLPAVVTQQGVRVDKSRANFLLFTMLSSSDPKFDVTALSDYAARATWCPNCSACPASARCSCSAPSAPCASGSIRPSCRASICPLPTWPAPSRRRTPRCRPAAWASCPT